MQEDYKPRYDHTDINSKTEKETWNSENLVTTAEDQFSSGS